ncbi:MAG: recombinase family protein [Christensenellales bacterium]|jgi:DNA invertase Pin-like site-specific DNA recombinase
MGQRIGYIRVSTDNQSTTRQEKQLENCDKLFVEKVSGKTVEGRPELKKMMAYVREGDTVVVESYSRFARSTRDLLLLIEELREKGVGFISLKENIDTNTPQGELMMTIFAGLSQFERQQILQRQAEGIAIAKAAGKYKGRKPIKVDKDAFLLEYRAIKEKRQTAVQAMNKLNLKPSTFYRRVKEYGLN